MLHVPPEYVLLLGYSVSLALIAMVLERIARHAHRRTLEMRTAGFTYHADRDVWQCPEDQHLFPVFADIARGRVIYRAPASACNACRSKPACTDSDQGRAIERKTTGGLQYGMQRFHRAVSLTLMVLASAMLAVELFRVSGLYPRAVLAAVLVLYCGIVLHLGRELLSVPADQQDASHHSRLQFNERGWFGQGR